MLRIKGKSKQKIPIATYLKQKTGISSEEKISIATHLKEKVSSPTPTI